MMGLDIVLVLLLGGLVAVDGTSFGQFMVSRPVVSATIAGWIVGAPVQGALVGLVLEVFHLVVLPVGAARYPEGGPAAVAAGAAFGLSNHASSTLLLIVLGALAFEWIGGETVRYLRLGNVRVLRPRDGTAPAAETLERRHLASIGIDYLRGVVLVAVGAVTMATLATLLGPHWGLDERTAELLLMIGVVAMLSSTFRVVGARSWFTAAGAAVGAVLLLLTA
jgi:mannose/fructose/N-acetylgalactosamine-specific phosphotransferase system component IIC